MNIWTSFYENYNLLTKLLQPGMGQDRLARSLNTFTFLCCFVFMWEVQYALFDNDDYLGFYYVCLLSWTMHQHQTDWTVQLSECKNLITIHSRTHFSILGHVTNHHHRYSISSLPTSPSRTSPLSRSLSHSHCSKLVVQTETWKYLYVL